MEYKIIQETDLKAFENRINDYLKLLGWLDCEIFYFKKEMHKQIHIAHIVSISMNLTQQQAIMRKIQRDDIKNKDPEYFQKIQNIFEKYKSGEL